MSRINDVDEHMKETENQTDKKFNIIRENVKNNKNNNIIILDS
jgi:hypothetical protein